VKFDNLAARELYAPQLSQIETGPLDEKMRLVALSRLSWFICFALPGEAL